jgi:apolipoprotein N-acyltransferase
MALCLASGLLLALAYPRAGLWPLAWVALVPWLTVAFTASRPVAVVGSLLAGFSFFGALMCWIAIFGYLPWALLALIEGLAFPLTAVVARIVAPRSPWRVVAVGIAWVTWEFARGQGRFGMPWGQVGHSQAPFQALAQLAAFGGVPAISLVVVIANAAFAHALVARDEGRRALTPLIYVGVVVIAVVALGAAHIGGTQPGAAVLHAGPPDGPSSVRVALVQASVKTWLTVEALNSSPTVEEQRSELAVYAGLTRRAAAGGAKVIIWPESAVPGYLQYESALREAVTALARELRVWLVVGGPSYEGERQHNSAFVISPQGAITGRYDKVHLVPFGEYVPGRDWLPLLRHYRVRDYDIVPGANHHLLGAGGFAFAPMICFESVFPEIARREARMGADALIIITNDAWFLRTAAAAQHLQIGRFRAIEQGLPVVRAASTGVSAFIAPSGRVTQSLGLMKRGVLVSQMRARRADTVYRRIGPAFSVSCAAAAALWVAAALVIRLARRRRGRGPWRG